MSRTVEIILSAVIIALNLFAFFLYLVDKRSVSSGRRIPEKFLLLSAFCFGSLGAMLAMELLRHKTDSKSDERKEVFTQFVPLSYLFQILIIVLWYPYHNKVLYIVLTALYAVVFGVIAMTRKSTHALQKRNRTENRSGGPGYRPENRPGNRPENRSGGRPGYRQGNRPGGKQGYRPGNRPENRQGYRR